MSNTSGAPPGLGAAKDIGLLPIAGCLAPARAMMGGPFCIISAIMFASAAIRVKWPSAPKCPT